MQRLKGAPRTRIEVVETNLSAVAAVASPGAAERRAGGRDRRAEALWRSVAYGAFRPRRRTGRRSSDFSRPIIDWHDPWLFASSTLVIIFCAIDAFLTLRLLENGAVEANPFMALYVYGDARRFAIVKLAMTGVGVLTLVSVARFRMFRMVRAGRLVHFVLGSYVALIGYELLLLERVS